MTRASISEVWNAVVDAGALSPDWAGLPGANAKAQIRIAAAAGGNVGWGVSGLNRRPTDYESAALTD